MLAAPVAVRWSGRLKNAAGSWGVAQPRHIDPVGMLGTNMMAAPIATQASINLITRGVQQCSHFSLNQL